MPGIYSQVTIEHILTEAKRRLKLSDTSDHDATLRMYISEGAGQLNNLRQHRKFSCVIDLEDNIARLPEGYYQLLGLRFVGPVASTTDDSNTTISSDLARLNVGYNLTYLDYRWLRDCNVNPSQLGIGQHCNYNVSFQILPGMAVFNTDIGDSVSQVQLAYTGINTDGKGNRVLYEDYVRALRSYACYMFASENIPDYDKFFIDLEQKTWVKQMRYIRGGDQQRSWDLNKYEIQQIVHSFFVDMWL